MKNDNDNDDETTTKMMIIIVIGETNKQIGDQIHTPDIETNTHTFSLIDNQTVRTNPCIYFDKCH